jgi:hypothetical protein
MLSIVLLGEGGAASSAVGDDVDPHHILWTQLTWSRQQHLWERTTTHTEHTSFNTSITPPQCIVYDKGSPNMRGECYQGMRVPQLPMYTHAHRNRWRAKRCAEGLVFAPLPTNLCFLLSSTAKSKLEGAHARGGGLACTCRQRNIKGPVAAEGTADTHMFALTLKPSSFWAKSSTVSIARIADLAIGNRTFQVGDCSRSRTAHTRAGGGNIGTAHSVARVNA